MNKQLKEIELKIAMGDLSAAKVFTIMMQHLNSKDQIIDKLRMENRALNDECMSHFPSI